MQHYQTILSLLMHDRARAVEPFPLRFAIFDGFASDLFVEPMVCAFPAIYLCQTIFGSIETLKRRIAGFPTLHKARVRP